MKYEKKVLIMIFDERNCENNPEIVDGSIENNAYVLYRKYMDNEITGDEIYTFETVGATPETSEEKAALEADVENGKAVKLPFVKSVSKDEAAHTKYMYFKSNYENLEGPEDFATKIIYVVTNGEQVYISYNGTIPYPKLGTVSVNVTIMEKNYSLSIPAEFDEFGNPWKKDDLGTVTDESGKSFDLNKVSVPKVPDLLWLDIAEEVVPNPNW